MFLRFRVQTVAIVDERGRLSMPKTIEVDPKALMPPLVAWLVLLGAAAFLIRPALDPVHVEGFSAAIVALGLHVASHSVQDFLPFAGLDADYFGLTKLGAVLGVAWLSPIFGADGAMKVLMWTGLAGLLGGCFYLVRRWSGAASPVVFASLVLIPGILESSYFLNDNLPAAGLMTVALALWSRSVSLPSSVVVGLLAGCAIAFRTDIVLVAVAAMPVIAFQMRSPRQAIAALALAALSALALLLLLCSFVGATLFDSLRVGWTAVQLWDRPRPLPVHFLMFVFFCGIPGLFLLAVGTLEIRRRRWLDQALLIGVPLFVNVMLLGKTWEVRQLLPLAPFFAALVAIGLQNLIDRYRGGERPIAYLFGIVLAISLFGPPMAMIRSDGPRSLSGRITALTSWREWQDTVHADLRVVETLADSARPGPPLAILTDGWTDDRYLHLELVKRGYRRIALPAPCDRIATGMRNEDRVVVQLSMMQTFVRYGAALSAERLERYALPCLATLRPARTVLLATADRVAAVRSNAGPAAPRRAEDATSHSPDLAELPLDGARLAALDREYRKLRKAFPHAPDAAEAMALTRSSTSFSR